MSEATRAQGEDLPAGNKSPRCKRCTHPMAWHDAEGCRYARGNVHGGCACERDARGKPIAKPAEPKKIASVPGTLFAKALDDAARALAIAASALAKAATEAHVAHADAVAAAKLPAILEPIAARPYEPPPLPPLNGAAVDAVSALAIATMQESDRKVLAALNAYHDGATRAQIVAVTGLADRTITDALSRLRGPELVARDALALTEEGRRVHASHPVDLPVIVLDGAKRDVLAACALLGDRATRRLLVLHTALADRTITDALSWLRTRGYVKPSALEPTPEGYVQTRGFEAPVGRGRALVNHWLAACEGADYAVFALIVGAHPVPLTRKEIEERSELATRTVTDVLSRLRSRLLVDRGSLGVSTEIADAIAFAER